MYQGMKDSIVRSCGHIEEVYWRGTNQEIMAQIEEEASVPCKECQRAQLISANSGLDQYDHNGKKSQHAVGAANIRRELKKAFPDVKFSVRSDSFSMGCSIDISWQDGPTTTEVDALINKYQYADFDGMTDSTTYRDDPWSDVFGGAKYVHGQRKASAETIAALTPWAEEQLQNRDCCSAQGIWNANDVIWRMVSATSFPAGQMAIGIEHGDNSGVRWPEDFYRVIFAERTAKAA